MDNFYQSIELTETEIQEALLERKKKKYFHERNKQYWIDEEQKGVQAYEDELRLNRIKRQQASSLSKAQTLPVNSQSSK